LSGTTAGNPAGLSAKTILSVTDGEVIIRANVGGGSGGSPLGIRLGITDGIIDVATGKSLSLNVAITEVTASSGYIKTGAGTLFLGGTGSNTGAIEINAGTVNATVGGALGATSRITVNTGGTLLLGGPSAVSDRINDMGTVTLDGGTFNTGGLAEGSRTSIGVGALTLQSTSTVDLGVGLSILHFADSHLANWTPNNVLEIDGWSGAANGNGTDQVIFGSNTSGLTLAQIAEIRFYNPNGFAAGTYSAMILANGELVPGTAVAEPATWFAGALGAWFLTIVSRFKKRRNPA
jgi:autotransporter-associated beta strand protein